MKVRLEVLGLIHLKGIENNSEIELEEGGTPFSLMTKVGILKEHQRIITVFINNEEKKKNTTLADGDVVKLFLPTGGG